jgi:hypothetical protein
MLDDRRAEHIPGCNMAFRRSTLLGIGAFDVQFRQAGDDVDVCWRLMDAGYTIGYAPAALVWHHRRTSVKAYFKQQAGYGRSEAMLQLKHPQRFNNLGYSKWFGVIYGEGSVGLPVAKPSVYHGKFGEGLFQIIYRRNDYTAWAYFTLFEWHLLAVTVGLFGLIHPAAFFVAGGMWILSLIGSLRAALLAPLPKKAPLWCRPLVWAMHLSQPMVRAWHRYKYRFNNVRIPASIPGSENCSGYVKGISLREHDLYFNSKEALGREHLLPLLVENAKQLNWHGDYGAEWEAHDVELLGDGWHNIRIATATEELGWPKRFTRVRCTLRPAGRGVGLFILVSSWVVLTILSGKLLPALIAAGAWVTVLGLVWQSRRRCRAAVSKLVFSSGVQAKLDPVLVQAGSAQTDMEKAGPEEAEVCLR